MTILEVNRQIKAWCWREQRRNQFISSIAYRLPTLIAISILDGKNYPEIYDAFPSEFDETTIKEERKKIQIEKDVATFRAWATQFNSRINGDGKE